MVKYCPFFDWVFVQPWFKMAALLGCGFVGTGLVGCHSRIQGTRMGSFVEGAWVESIGTAPIVNDDVLAARRAALAEAQRSAVEKIVGVTVSGKTVVDKAVAVQNVYKARTGGIIEQYEILEEEKGESFYRLGIRAYVALKSSGTLASEIQSEDIDEALLQGIAHLDRRQIPAAFESLIDAAKKAHGAGLSDSFPTLKSSLDRLFSSVQGQAQPKVVIFREDGSLLGPIRIKIADPDSGKTKPIQGFPLSAQFTAGRGKVSVEVRTDEAGVAILSGFHIDPYKDRAVLEITPGWDLKQTGLRWPSSLRWQVEFRKQRKVSLSVIRQSAQSPRSRDLDVGKRILDRVSCERVELVLLTTPVLDLSQEEDARQEFDFSIEVVVKSSAAKHPILDVFQVSVVADVREDSHSDQETSQKSRTFRAQAMAVTEKSSIDDAVRDVEGKIVDYLNETICLEQ